MELMFNELSTNPISENSYFGKNKLINFCETYKKANEKGFLKIRSHKQSTEIVLAPSLTLYDCLLGDLPRRYKDLLFSVIIHPFIDDSNDGIVTRYLEKNYFFKNESNDKIQCMGLAAAYIYQTLSISFSGITLWEQNYIPIIVEKGDSVVSETVKVPNISKPESFETEYINSFCESIFAVNLTETSLKPKEKDIHLRNDHGKDKLLKLAKKLIHSPYVTEIINSIPYNSKVSRFIKDCYRDGKIEIVLFREDEGFGMIIQTTGKTYRETEEIGRILEENYS